MDRLGAGSSLTGAGFGGIRIANKSGECLHVVAAAASPPRGEVHSRRAVYTQPRREVGVRKGKGREKEEEEELLERKWRGTDSSLR